MHRTWWGNDIQYVEDNDKDDGRETAEEVEGEVDIVPESIDWFNQNIPGMEIVARFRIKCVATVNSTINQCQSKSQKLLEFKIESLLSVLSKARQKTHFGSEERYIFRDKINRIEHCGKVLFVMWIETYMTQQEKNATVFVRKQNENQKKNQRKNWLEWS